MSFTKEFKKTMAKIFAKKEDANYNYRETYKQRLMDFRKFESTVTKMESPINVVRAKALGYKAKKGIFTAVVRVHRGGGLFIPEHNGRRPKRMGFKKLTRNISVQRIAELRASTKHPNCEVINSYFVGEDGKHKYYEVILASKNQPELVKDKKYTNMLATKGRAERGLTSAGKKTRGLRKVKQTTKK